MVERSEMYVSIVTVSEVTPFRYVGAEVGEASSSPSNYDVSGCLEGTTVVA